MVSLAVKTLISDAGAGQRQFEVVENPSGSVVRAVGKNGVEIHAYLCLLLTFRILRGTSRGTTIVILLERMLSNCMNILPAQMFSYARPRLPAPANLDAGVKEYATVIGYWARRVIVCDFPRTQICASAETRWTGITPPSGSGRVASGTPAK